MENPMKKPMGAMQKPVASPMVKQAPNQMLGQAQMMQPKARPDPKLVSLIQKRNREMMGKK